MKYYLSSYKLGNETEKLNEFIHKTTNPFGYIPNALDFTDADQEWREKHIETDINDLKTLGTEVELIDLKDYFGKKDDLKEKLLRLGGLYISGGNTFILRQAMKLSGLDKLILEMKYRNDFVYAGYSAAVCVLSPTLKYYAITDDSTDMPYAKIQEPIWEGLGIIDFVFEPHYHSDHLESASTDKEIQYLIDEKVLFKAYKDGDVLILE